jgi:hypothetical protein
MEVNLSPAALKGTHLGAIASGFERYRFTSVAVGIFSRAPTVVAGGYLAGITPDVHQVIGNGTQAKRYVRSLEGSVAAPWWTSTETTMDTRECDTWYYVATKTGEAYKTTQGKFYLVVDGPPSVNISLSVQLKWTARFSVPAVQVDASGTWRIPSGTAFGMSGEGYAYLPAQLNLFWKESHYKTVYAINPPIAGKFRHGNDAVDAVALQVGFTTAGSAVVGFFDTLDAAFKMDFEGQMAAGKTGTPLRPITSTVVSLDADIILRALGPVNP